MDFLSIVSSSSLFNADKIDADTGNDAVSSLFWKQKINTAEIIWWLFYNLLYCTDINSRYSLCMYLNSNYLNWKICQFKECWFSLIGSISKKIERRHLFLPWNLLSIDGGTDCKFCKEN